MDPVIEVSVTPETTAPVVVAPASVSAQAAEIVETATGLAEKLARSDDETGAILGAIADLRFYVGERLDSLDARFGSLSADVQTLGTIAVVAASEPEPVAQVAEAASEVASAAADVSTAAAEAVPEEQPQKRSEKKAPRRWL